MQEEGRATGALLGSRCRARGEREKSRRTPRFGARESGRMEQGHLGEDQVSGRGYDFNLGHAKRAVSDGHPRDGR